MFPSIPADEEPGRQEHALPRQRHPDPEFMGSVHFVGVLEFGDQTPGAIPGKRRVIAGEVGPAHHQGGRESGSRRTQRIGISDLLDPEQELLDRQLEIPLHLLGAAALQQFIGEEGGSRGDEEAETERPAGETPRPHQTPL